MTLASPMIRVLPIMVALTALATASTAAPVLDTGNPDRATNVVLRIEARTLDEAGAPFVFGGGPFVADTVPAAGRPASMKLFEISAPPGAPGTLPPGLPATVAGAFARESGPHAGAHQLRVTDSFTDASPTGGITTTAPLPGTAALLGAAMALTGLYRLRGGTG